ncbi:MAG: RDD family protein [Candidatus Rokuibacteriota bacterium]|nr:MAG: RDD family protein [Candidatus Rokubacteria bacterium]
MTEGRPAGFWIRALAALLDFLVFLLVQFSFGLIGGRVWGPDVASTPTFRPIVVLFTVVFAGAYSTLLLALGGQTIGKMLVGVRVVAGEELPSIGAALLRFIGYFVSLGTLTLGYVMAGLRQDKRALHDLIAGTRVEYVSRADAEAPVAPPPAATADASSSASGPV